PHFSWSWKAASFRPGTESAVEITGQDRNVPPGHERANAAFEFLERAGSGPRAFGKNDEDISRIGEQFAADCETLPRVRLPREWQRIDHHRGDPGARHALEEIVCR